MSAPYAIREVSSAYLIDKTGSIFLLKSFTYNINNVGPRIVPWGTPMVKTHDLDEISLHLTICLLLFK